MRARFGSHITYLSQSYSCSVQSIGSDDPDYIPAGPGGNAAFTDERVFTLNPADLPARPAPGDSLTWDGASYTVLGTRVLEWQGQAISWRTVAYRSTASQPSVKASQQIGAWKLPDGTSLS